MFVFLWGGGAFPPCGGIFSPYGGGAFFLHVGGFFSLWETFSPCVFFFFMGAFYGLVPLTKNSASAHRELLYDRLARAPLEIW